MTSLSSRCTACAFLVAAGLALSTPAIAQQAASGPVAGQWAAEAGFGGTFGSASLIHFSSAAHAWLFGLTGSVEHASDQLAAGAPVFSSSTEGINAQLGMRRYHASGEALHPYWGLGIVGDARRSNDARILAGGGYGEFGAAYFLAPHFSLGSDGRLEAEYQRQSGAAVGHEWVAEFGLVRLTAAVYF